MANGQMVDGPPAKLVSSICIQTYAILYTHVHKHTNKQAHEHTPTQTHPHTHPHSRTNARAHTHTRTHKKARVATLYFNLKSKSVLINRGCGPASILERS